jgi:hypothetical protein
MKEQSAQREKSAHANPLFDSRNLQVFWSPIFPSCILDDLRILLEAWKLHDLLLHGIATAVAAQRRHTTTNRKPNCRPPVPNGARILSSVCLGYA